MFYCSLCRQRLKFHNTLEDTTKIVTEIAAFQYRKSEQERAREDVNQRVATEKEKTQIQASSDSPSKSLKPRFKYQTHFRSSSHSGVVMTDRQKKERPLNITLDREVLARAPLSLIQPERTKRRYFFKKEDASDERVHAFVLASELGSLEHPLCSVCAKSMTERFQSEGSNLEQENHSYQNCLKIIEENLQLFNEDDSDLLDMQNEIVELEKELTQIVRERKKICEETERLERSYIELIKKESNAISLCNTITQKFDGLLKVTQDNLEFFESEKQIYQSLNRTNVFNEAFVISFDLHIATINGAKLGRTASQPVDWDEFNAALGYTVLMAKVIAGISNFQSNLFQIIPFGSKSKIIKFEANPPQEYDLFFSPKLFSKHRFDTAFQVFLDSVAEIANAISSFQPSFALPFPINKNKVGDCEMSIPNEDMWTKGARKLLIDLKGCLLWALKTN